MCFMGMCLSNMTVSKALISERLIFKKYSKHPHRFQLFKRTKVSCHRKETFPGIANQK